MQHLQKAFDHRALPHSVINFKCHQVLITEVFHGSFSLIKNSTLSCMQKAGLEDETQHGGRHMCESSEAPSLEGENPPAQPS